MATFFVDNTGVVTTASTDSDSIFIQSAALPGSEILGEAGNDTINLMEGSIANGSAVGAIVRGADGNDQINASGLGAFSAGNHTLIGGTGNDTVVLGGSNADWVKTNNGSDRVVLSGTGSYSAIALGGGADELVIAGSQTIDRVSLGDGHDKISASTILFATAASVVGGKGRDTIDLTIGAGISSAFINGGALQDSITLNGLEEGTTVKGMGGADTITVSGDVDGTSAFIAAGAGADLVTISGFSEASTVAGGAGNDTIVFADNLDGVSAVVLGGSDNDSISFNNLSGSSKNPGANDDYSKITIEGGLGADSIVFSSNGTVGSGAILGTLAYSSFSESNLAGTDVFQLNGTILSGTKSALSMGVDFTDTLKSATVTEGSAVAMFGDATFSGNVSNQIVTLSGSTYLVSSVTAVAGTVDTLTLKDGKGASVIFSTSSGADYLFVQGGTAGTADDSVISLGNLSGMGLSMNGSALLVTFSGQV